ncbi:hypothetical protein [Anaerocellum diazotrophicum]|uniref:Uncharacterized protein n=1 Tax=Caldicellulosiruptor diazotrophicus TaxID=2806205 RepID=A0ABM7NLB9_9FIRM|nr:hypothetical protein [Caldicellulosiruptor diazotrophicus]BCS80913.1 hypothetical protein CaldiYA01_08730 [Caldicellulosiruptor diazotrophicus]
MENSNKVLEATFNLFINHPELLKIYLGKAIDILLKRDLYFLKKGLHERAISYCLAIYIE